MKTSLRKNEPFRRYMIFLPHSLCLIYTTYMLGGAWKVTFQRRRRRKFASTRTSKGSETAAPWRFKFQNPCRSQWTTGTLKFINDDDLHCSIFWLARFRKPWSIRLWRPQGTSIRFKIFTRTGARVKGYISCKGYHEKDLFCSLPSGSLERPHFLRRYSASLTVLRRLAQPVLPDKHGQLGIWDARAPPDECDEDCDIAPENREGGKYWRLQLHWPESAKSSISNIKLDPIDAHNVWNLNFDDDILH